LILTANTGAIQSAMSSYEQAGRPLTVTTPLGNNKLLLVGLRGTEAISQLFRYQLELIAANDTNVPFDQILGKPVTAHITAPGGDQRHVSGICSRFVQGGRDPYFTSYRAEIVPEFWFLTRKAQSRIFEQKTVPQILQTVFQGLKTTAMLKGDYPSRDYCVQYRETDFNFACRLMEEEGIFYFFKHTAGSHEMVYADNPGAHPPVPFGTKATYAALEASSVEEERITDWEKTQDLRSMKFLLWDHSFEKPHEHLQAEKPLTASAQAGQVSHKLVLGDGSRLEVYDWPGEYAQRFDGVGPGKEDRPQDIQKIFTDNKRTVDIRMQQEAAACLSIAGAGRLRQLTAGHKFTLEKHFNADGEYVLTAVHHHARLASNYRSGEKDVVSYQNSFTCLPASVPFRPQRSTPKPVIQGTQTAVVVGPKGEEVWTDKYGRVKVQFHWDRADVDYQKRSCWIRVAQLAAGRRWGTSAWPRIGQEVVVDYLEGDPDQPIIVGVVYNADQMPPYLGKGPDSKHPDENLISGVKSNTSKGGAGFNELRLFDAKGKEQIFIHAERNMDTRVKHDGMEWVKNNRHLIVGDQSTKDQAGDQLEEVWRDKHLRVHRHQVEHIEGNVQLLIGEGSAGGGNLDVKIEKNRTESVGSDVGLTVGSSRQEKIGKNQVLEAGQEIHLKAGMKVIIEAGTELTIKGAGGFVKIDASGVTIEGTMVNINCGGSASSANSASPASPQKAQPTTPTQADDAMTGQKSN
jgi:type VI secretion system secreted protein VgrG